MRTLTKFFLFLVKAIPSSILLYSAYALLQLKSYRKQVINNNYKNTIGHNLSKSEIHSFFKKCLFNISRILIETLTFSKGKTEYVSYHNVEELEKSCSQQNGLVLMASHYGNWELACINLPLHTSLPCYGVYKPLKNKVLDELVLNMRSKFGLKLIPMNSIARSIAENHSTGTPAIYILIADQNPRSASSVVWKDFLGIKTAFSNGLEKFLDKYNLATAYMHITPKEKMFHYSISFEYPSESDLKDPIQWYSNRVERQIRNKEEYWLWSHKRWKRKFNSH